MFAMKPTVIVSLLLSLLPSAINTLSTFSPARPPAQPLAVKSPYLSAWQVANNGGYLAGQWPTFWYGAVLGWTGLISVDGHVYCWMGAPGNLDFADQFSYNYTSTSSIYEFSVGGKVQLTATFTSPITPDDYKRQSLIFSYLDVKVASLDGSKHDVQIYTDISAEWVSGDRSQLVQWEYGTNESIAYHKIYRQTQGYFQEMNEQAEWGNWWYSTTTEDGYTYQSGTDVDVRAQFTNNSKLTNNNDTNYRAIDDDWPVFAHAFDLGSIGTNSTSRVFSIGLTQEYAIQYLGADGVVASLPSLWSQYFPDEISAVVFAQSDYNTASSLAAKLDAKVQTDTVAVSQDYATLATLSLRQAFGGIQLVGTNDTQYIFLKEISSDGNIQTVDVIFPAHPAFVYTNPALLKMLLEPLFVNQEAGLYPNSWSMHDLGGRYPNATGHTDGQDEQMPLEECGNMLIMSLQYYLASEDIDFLKKHYKLLDQWTQFLIQESLYPANQISTDDFAGALANQTNLAIKGMIGIQAMAVIANITGDEATSSNYSSIASSYVSQWQTLAFNNDVSPAHALLDYNDDSSWGLLYNLYGDKALGLNLVPQSVYDTQSAFYLTVADTYGIALDTRHPFTKGDWESWIAAVCSDDVTAMLFSKIANWINVTTITQPLTDLYESNSEEYDGGTFTNRPVMGGVFAKLVLGMGLHA